MPRRNQSLEKMKREKPWACMPGKTGDHFQPLFASLMRSPAFTDMRKGSRLLLMACMTEADGEAAKENVNPDTGAYNGSYFYMNRHLYADVYNLYDAANGTGFRRDMEDLVDHGFVEVVVRGRGRGIKNLYKLSSKWRSWQRSEKGEKITQPATIEKGEKTTQGSVFSGGEKITQPLVRKPPLLDSESPEKGEKNSQVSPGFGPEKGEKTTHTRIYTPCGTGLDGDGDRAQGTDFPMPPQSVAEPDASQSMRLRTLANKIQVLTGSEVPTDDAYARLLATFHAEGYDAACAEGEALVARCGGGLHV